MDQFNDRMDQWHSVFLWLPTQMLDGQWVWLETVERKRDRRFSGMCFAYRPIGSDSDIPPPPPPSSLSQWWDFWRWDDT